MTDFGLVVVNASSQTQIDSKFRNYSFVKSGIAYSDYSSYPYCVATYPTQTISPIVLFKPRQKFAVNLAGVTASRAWFNTNKNATLMVPYQVWQRGIVKPATWGININNASGDTVFSSEDNHFIIKTVQTGTYTAATNNHTYSAGVHYLASVNSEYISVSPAGIRAKYDEDSDLAVFYERGAAWGFLNSNASLTSVGELVNFATLVGDYPDNINTMQATYTIVGVKDHVKGPGRRWGEAGIWRDPSLNDYSIQELKVVDATLALLSIGSVVGQSKNNFYQYWGGYAVAGKPGLVTGTTILSYYVSTADGVANGTMCLAGVRRRFLRGVIQKSTDRGESWNIVSYTASDTYPYKIRMMSATRALMTTVNSGTQAKVWRTVDGGENWSEVHDFSGSSSGLWSLHVLSEKNALVGAQGFIAKTTDYGKTWSTATRLNVVANAKPVQLVIYDFETVTGSVVLLTTYPDAQVWRSTDDGNSWAKVADFSATQNVHPQDTAYCVTSYEGQYCFVGTGQHGQIWRSSDAGLTWPDLVEETKYTFRAKTKVTNIVTLAATKLIAATSDSGTYWRTFDHHN